MELLLTYIFFVTYCLMESYTITQSTKYLNLHHMYNDSSFISKNLVWNGEDWVPVWMFEADTETLKKDVSLPTVVGTVEETKREENITKDESNYEVAKLSNDNEAFFTSLYSHVNPEETSSDTILNQDNLLVVEDYENEVQKVEIDEKYTAISQSKIADNLLGEQRWVVEVIGEEQGLLHVSDGTSRAWINAINFSDVTKGDVLEVFVVCTEVENLANEINMLQKHSKDFDVEEYHENMSLSKSA